MALREILTDGDATLRKTSRVVIQFDRRLHQLLDDMGETLVHVNGKGLAAPQIGVLRRVVVVDVGTQEEPDVLEIINPEIIESEDIQCETEGCLSIPGLRGTVERPLKLKVRALDRYGNAYEIEGEEFMAQAMSHEIDHLDGILFIDKPSFKLLPKEEPVDEE